MCFQQQKQNVSDLQQAIASAKRKYADALSRLENISEEIHESRRQKILLMFPREPGVGADSDSLCSSLSESCIGEQQLLKAHSSIFCHSSIVRQINTLVDKELHVHVYVLNICSCLGYQRMCI